MKQKLSLWAILMIALTMPAVAQNLQRTDPNHAYYNIIGEMKVDDNNNQRYLIDANGKHIDFTYYGRRLAKPTEMADLVVRFDSVTTNPFHPMTKLDFWRYDEEIGEWIYDSEVRQGEQQMESTMKTNIMLVIDNSRSLGNDFKKVQDAAVEFVGQLYRESQGKEIFRVGVIGFSTVQFTKVREITSLDATNYREIVNFIRNLQMQNGTAFYYSLEMALTMLNNDALNNIATDEYKESRIYAFTDGLDQASVDDSRKLSTPTQYYDHLRPMMYGNSRTRINNKIVSSTIVTVRGGDMTDGQERQFDQRAQAICDDVRKLKDMSQLVSEFKKLAEDLVKNNMVLYCYIPVGANGRVGWTFAEEKTVAKVPNPPQPKKFWLGVGLDGGLGWFTEHVYPGPDGDYTDRDVSYIIALRADAIWPLSSVFGLGGTLSLGYNFDLYGDYNYTGFAFRLGPLAKFTFSNGSALFAGLGLHNWSHVYGEDIGPYITLGWKFSSPWYINTYLISGLPNAEPGFGIGVGYSICGGRNK